VNAYATGAAGLLIIWLYDSPGNEAGPIAAA
jgi:hypothetical protein